MKKTLLLSLVLLLVLGFLFRNPIQAASNNYLYYSPCDTPLLYSVGDIDERFNITQDEVVRRAKIAEDTWEKAYKKDLFNYDPDSSFKIGLVYDDRQGLSSRANELDTELKSESSAISERIKAYEARSQEFENSLSQLNEDIQYWNSRGGAPEEEYNNLKQRQETLRAEAQALNEEGKALNQSTDKFNAQAKMLNQTLEVFNEALDEKPEGGIYTQHGEDRNITIYFNNSEEEFVYTVTHEMGHSLGLPHTPDKESIMYPRVNLAKVPSSSDIELLDVACKKRSIFTPLLTRFQSGLQRIIKPLTN